MRLSFLLFIFLFFSACQQNFQEPAIDLSAYQIEEGFELEVIASEPLIEAPVVMQFDENGRMWVLEMQGYMQNIDGTDEDLPNGRILILEDKDEDGRMDHAKVFLDSLVLPRAMALVHGGLLYATPPNLWFVDIQDDQAANPILVDSAYAVGGNVEHQPNALLRHLDNWIYNAKSNARYRKIGEEWVKEKTAFRGQWGLTNDNYGHLFYNDNSNQLQGDYVMPNTLSRNTYMKVKAGLGQRIATDQRLYPLHATAVNRGYIDGILHEDGKLQNFTSACGPLIYRGEQFPEIFHENAFVCAPEANLIKRNILQYDSAKIMATQAYEGKEFLATTDEAFRPVNLCNAPDGSMYILDMHRGIIQHSTYMTSYLREKLLEKGLDKVVNMGRILRVRAKDKMLSPLPRLGAMSSLGLVEQLNSPNGWVRDKAQQLLVESNDKEVIPALEAMLQNSMQPLAQIHALWTLEGMGEIPNQLVKELVLQSGKQMQIQLIRFLLQQNEMSSTDLMEMVALLLEKNNLEIDLQLAMFLGNLPFNMVQQAMTTLVQRYPENDLIHEGLLSGMEGREEDLMLAFSEHIKPQVYAGITSKMQETVENKAKLEKMASSTNHTIFTDQMTRGLTLYRTHCATCHGVNGQGVEPLAPPLYDSEYVSGPKDRLVLIALHGMQGPVHVNGKLYEMSAVMPGIANSPELSDEDIVSILNFVRNAFSTSPRTINTEDIARLRGYTPGKGMMTEPELLAIE